MNKNDIIEFISEQKTAFIASVDENGFPVIRAMLAPRVIDGNVMYFTTNTSSKKNQTISGKRKSLRLFL